MSANNIPESMSAKYRDLFVRTKNLIVTPKQEWQAIFNEKSDANMILANYVLPYIGALSLLSFVSHLASHSSYPFESALKQAVLLFTSFFLGLYVTYFITIKLIPKFTVKTYASDIKILAYKLTAYSSLILYLVKISTALIPQIYFLHILGLYVAYLVWLGSGKLGEFESIDLRIVFSIIVSVLLLFVPYFLLRIFVNFIHI
ncbi:hypothetical protein SAMN06265379_107159 [Saccharicrinis carchari]|uniref:Uncharacterized protein n=1 Tax=Saccharicrinis carchari TaxID=1168039 RepID=A0A521E5F4_SACCC|nr:hypothetical protein [Saccharicrinis carchari]SMO78390.1 hypothetical protein SAMN06265379_107159 [Saccharicrinis carchari]